MKPKPDETGKLDEELRKLLADVSADILGPCDPDTWKPWREPLPPFCGYPEGLTWLDRMRVCRAVVRARAKAELRFWCRLGIWRLRRWVNRGGRSA